MRKSWWCYHPFAVAVAVTVTVTIPLPLLMTSYPPGHGRCVALRCVWHDVIACGMTSFRTSGPTGRASSARLPTSLAASSSPCSSAAAASTSAVRHVVCAMCHGPWALCHLPSALCRVPCAACRPQCAVCCAPRSIRRPPRGAWRVAWSECLLCNPALRTAFFQPRSRRHFQFAKSAGGSYINPKQKEVGKNIAEFIAYYRRRKDGMPSRLERLLLPSGAK